MGFVKPAAPPFEVEDWMGRPYFERVRMMSGAWAMQGLAAPGVAYVFYLIKLVIYVGGFLLFASATKGIGGISQFGDWWSEPIVFEKAVLWTLLYEGVGLGCASGPLTGRYLPPVTAFVHWLRPGTTRLPPFPRVPFTAGHKRTVVDCLLYAAHVVLVVRALLADRMTTEIVLPIIVVLLVLGLRDKTVFLASRAEHFLLASFVFLFPHDLLAGSKVVQLALWFGAASSKLNQHFPNVIAVMMSNNPFLRSKRVRRMLYRSYPDDLRGSPLAAAMAHGATVVEYSLPLLLLFTHGGTITTVALIGMVVFHSIILTSFPMGVPLEWNVFFIYSALVLFGDHHEVRAWSIHSPLLAVVLLLCLVGVPVLGNLRPDKVSFLPSMRYYAGNWGASVWLFRPGQFETLDDHLTKLAKVPRRQLEPLYGEGSYEVILGRIQAFRGMHLHGRALNALLPLAIADLHDPDVTAKGLDAFEIVDGELVAGVSLGWNFGDGHLHNESLLTAIQAQCHFAPGQLRCVFLEGQPVGKSTMHWRIADAADGQLAEGHIEVADLLDIQPWGGTLAHGAAPEATPA